MYVIVYEKPSSVMSGRKGLLGSNRGKKTRIWSPIVTVTRDTIKPPISASKRTIHPLLPVLTLIFFVSNTCKRINYKWSWFACYMNAISSLSEADGGCRTSGWWYKKYSVALANNVAYRGLSHTGNAIYIVLSGSGTIMTNHITVASAH